MLTLDGVTGPVSWGDVVFGLFVFFVAWYAGRRLRLRVEHREHLLREQQAEARRIVAEELSPASCTTSWPTGSAS